MKYLLSFLLLLVCYAHAGNGNHSVSKYHVEWKTPSENAYGSMPLGNGDIAANVWVEPSGDLLFYISKSDAWDGNGRLLKVGRVRLTCTPSLFMPGDRFVQTLDLEKGCINIRSVREGLDIQLSVWVDANHPSVHVQYESSADVRLTAKIDPWRVEKQPYTRGEVSDLQEDRSKPNKLAKKVFTDPDVIVKGLENSVAWYHHNATSDGFAMTNELQGLGDYFKEDPLLKRTFGGMIHAEHATRVDDFTLLTQAAQKGHVEVNVLTAHPSTPAQWIEQIQALSKSSQASPIERRRRDHNKWWEDFWNRSWIHLSDAQDKTAPSMIPASTHPLKVGVDQHGGNRFDGAIGRLSLIAGVLTDERAGLLAKGDRQQLPMQEGVFVSTVDVKPGHILKGFSKDKLKRSWSVEAWIKPDKKAGRIIDCITPGGSDGFLLDTYPGDGLRFIAGKETIAKTNCLKPNQWYHVIASVNEVEGVIKVYLDGVKIAEYSEDRIGDAELVSRSYHLQRYLDACAGRGNYPIKFNGSLFTMPHEGDPDYRRWGPGYWWQNTRLPYLSMTAAGDYDLMQPLFKMYAEDCYELNKYRTKKYFGHGGAFFAECAYFWGPTFTQTYGWKPYGQRKDKLQESPWHKWEWVAGPELIFMMLDYYDYTLDKEFLVQKTIPVALDVIRFFDQHYETNADGELVMHPSMACETWWECTNPMPELAGLHAVTRRLLALPEVLLESKDRMFVQTFSEKLVPLPVRQVGGKQAFAPATKFAQKRNVENPELYAVFPFRLSSFEKDNVELGKAALEHRWDRGAFGWRQDDLFMAYLGLRDQTRDFLTKRCRNYDKKCRFPAFWGPNYDWTPDQDHGGVMMRTVQAMVLQADPYSRKIYLNPALPKEWNCDFKLHAPYNTIVEGSIRQGEISGLKVTPESRRADVVIVK